MNLSGHLLRSQDDLKYTKENFSNYSTVDFSGAELKKIREKFDKLNVDKLNKLIRISVTFEVIFYFFVFCAIALAFVFWGWNYGRVIPSKDYTGLVMISLVGFFFLLHVVFIRFRYKNYERYIQIKGTKHSDFNKRSITWLGDKMTTSWIDRYENNITGFVYFGAGLLVVVVGLRGLGERIMELGFPFPSWLVAKDGLKLGVIFVALFIEFGLLVFLALFTFFKDEEKQESEKPVININFGPIEGILNQIKDNSAEIKHLLSENGEKLAGIRQRLESIDEKTEKDKVKELLNELIVIFEVKLKEIVVILGSVETEKINRISESVLSINQSVDKISVNIKDPELKTRVDEFTESMLKIKNILGMKL
ncbi:MAG: hypothetical protein AB9882_11545 [Ignavibacteriaceae bacterium]